MKFQPWEKLIPTNPLAKTMEQAIDELLFINYCANRDRGMMQGELESVYNRGNLDAFEERYQEERRVVA